MDRWPPCAPCQMCPGHPRCARARARSPLKLALNGSTNLSWLFFDHRLHTTHHFLVSCFCYFATNSQHAAHVRAGVIHVCVTLDDVPHVHPSTVACIVTFHV